MHEKRRKRRGPGTILPEGTTPRCQNCLKWGVKWGDRALAVCLPAIARRICVHELARRAAAHEVQPAKARDVAETEVEQPPQAQVGLESLEEVQKLLSRLPSRERRVVALFYLEGRS